ncbi:hypothetical protein FACS1894111_04850 [Clostridia bacterium]|nr:hypothetical protein FACS1894111_04850 [Clostridia bacterium]
MLPAKQLYTQHTYSKIFILELVVLVSLISDFTANIFTIFFEQQLDEGIIDIVTYFMIFTTIKIIILIIAYFLYHFFVRKPIQELVATLDEKIGRYIPASLVVNLFLFGFGEITGYMHYDLLHFIPFYVLLATTFGILYWLIFSGAVWTSKILKTESELNVASNIQRDMLPSIFPPFPQREEFDLSATMQPAKEVGGDFYDFFFVDDDHLALVMADVSGKGVPAALFMVIAKTILKNLAQSGLAVEEIMRRANEQLCENNQSGMFVTAFMGIYELPTGKFSFANAGHNPPYVRKTSGQFEMLSVTPGFVLAGIEGMTLKHHETMLKPGDVLYLYTDGVTEALNKHDELYGEIRLEAVLNKLDCEKDSVDAMLQKVKDDLDHFANGTEQADDITMLMLRVKK